MNSLRIPNYRVVIQNISWQSRLVKAVSFSMLALLVVTYIGVTNSVATQGYVLNQLQKAQTEMERENAGTELAITAAQSLPRISSEATALSLAPALNIEYLATAASAVALR